MQYIHRRDGHIVQNGLVGKQVEGLKYHADLGAKLSQLTSFLRNLRSVDADFSGVNGLQAVDGPAQGRFTGTGGADDYDDLALFHG